MKRMTAFPFTSNMTYDERGWPKLDRAVDSTVLRELLQLYYTNGVVGISESTCLQVSAEQGGTASVLVKPGSAMIQGATGYIKDPVTLELTAGDSVLPRYDTVVARLNDNMDFRGIYLDILIGQPSSSPQPPALTRTDSVWELGLANLYRLPSSTVVTDSSITDTRQDSDRCGYVAAIHRLDTASLMQQLNAFYAEFVAQANQDYAASRAEYLQQCQEIVDVLTAFETASEGDFETWFEHMKDHLTEDQAGHLQTEIDDLVQSMFEDLYGLCSRVTTVRKNTRGETEAIEEEDSTSQIRAVTTFAETDGRKTITTVVTPPSGGYTYNKTATFEVTDGNGSKKITESFTKNLIV